MRNAESVSVMLCPVCKTGLTMSDRQGVEIDYCPTCRGVWLDRGELDKVIERSVEAAPPTRREPEPPPSRGYRQGGYQDDHDRYRHGKRKKSFLSELFD